MLKHILCLTILMTAAGMLAGQTSFTSEGKTSMVVFDNNGKPFENPPVDIAGSPFLRDEWRLGSLTTSGADHRRFDSVKIRLNLMTQEVHFMNKDNIEIALFRGYIGKVRFYDSAKIPGGGAEFLSGFPAIDNQDESNFYEVLCKGKLWLLESLRKVVSQEKNEFSGETKKEFVSYEDYYIFTGESMSRVKKDRALIDGKEIRFKSIGELKKLIDQYNAP